MPRHLPAMRFDEESVRQLACREEKENIEFKQKLPGFKDLSEYAVGIGNAGGGLLVVGITNKRPRTFVDVGELSNEQLKKIQLSIHDSTGIRVSLQEIRTADGLNILVIQIPGRPKGRIFSTQTGKYLIRVGENLVGLSANEVAAILAEGKWPRKISVALGLLTALAIAIGAFTLLRQRKGGALQPESESRSHIHVYGFKSSPQKLGEPAMVNVMFVNDGKSKATVRAVCKISFLHVGNFDPVEEDQRQDYLFAPFLETAEQRLQSAEEYDFDVPVGTKNFTTCFGPKYTSQALKLIQTHEFRLYYLGLVRYSDKTGEYRSTFCGFTESDPNVFFVCKKYNDER